MNKLHSDKSNKKIENRTEMKECERSHPRYMYEY